MKKILVTSLAVFSTMWSSAATANSSTEYCREYQRTVTIGGEQANAYGTTCMQPDGSWKIVSGSEAQVIPYNNAVPARTEYVEVPPQVVIEKTVVIRDSYKHKRNRPKFFSTAYGTTPYYRSHHSNKYRYKFR